MGWLELATNSLDAARITTGLAANWLIQSTLLIAGGLAVGFFLRHRGSAVQSVVYRTTLVAVLICPLATLGLSSVGVSGWSLVMPSAYALEGPAVNTNNGLEFTRTPLPNSPAESGLSMDQTVLSIVPPPRSDFPPPRESSDGADGKDALSPPNVADLALLAAAPSEPAERSKFELQHFGTLSALAAALWLIAGICLLGRLALGWRHLHRLRRDARAADALTIESCHQIAARLQVAQPEVLHSPYLPSPCLAGVRRPAVMLPETDLSLPVRDVLVHELAHLVRNDCLWNMLRQCATAVLFFQPLLWKLSRRLAATAEEVCDDYVVQFGGDRHEYAHRLVNIATLSVAPATAGVGIVSFRSMLASRVARILDTSRLLSTRVGNLLLGILLLSGLVATLLVGLVGVKPNRLDAKTAIAVPDANEAESAKEPEIAPDVDDAITVSGVVVDPKGVPLSGADVYALRWFWEHGEPKPLAATRSDANGRFTISYRKSQYFETGARPEQWREASIAAFASGFGPAWINYEELRPGAEAKLRLAVDDVPIEGRILDLEGNPIAGVRVAVEWLDASSDDDLTRWIAGVRSGQSMPMTSALFDKSHLPIFSSGSGRWPNIVTDADGRFRISDLGRERLVRFHISGDGIATRSLAAVTRRMDPITQPSYGKGTPPLTNFGAEFVYTAAPSRPVEGFVRDSATGQPLSSVEVRSDPFSLEGLGGANTVKTLTDEGGFYRLHGLPKGPGNEIHVLPKDQPYFSERLKVADPQGVDAVKQDFNLCRGIWVSGRITDKVTGKPVAAHIKYAPLTSNALANKSGGQFLWSHRSEDGASQTHVDGTYRVVAMPGRGIIRVDSVLEAYPNGQGYEAAAKIARREGLERFAGPLTPSRGSPTAFKEIHAASANDDLVCDFALDPGRRITIETVESNGAPIANVRVQGWRGRFGDFKRMEASRFDLLAFGTEEVRTVQLHSKDRNLGKALLVSAAEGETAAKTITLEPCAAVTGRLVDADGQPLRGASLIVRIIRDGELDSIMERLAADSDGRFHSAQILPGLPVGIGMQTAHGNDPAVVKRLEVRPGETIDLGTVDITSDKRPEMIRTAASVIEPAEKVSVEPQTSASRSAAVARKNAGDDQITGSDKLIQDMKGQVLGPDGKPVSIAADLQAANNADLNVNDNGKSLKSLDASENSTDEDVVTVNGLVVNPSGKALANTDVYVLRWFWNYGDRRPLAQTKTDDRGRFTISYRKSQFSENSGRPDQWREAMIVAFADGFGPSWVTYQDLARNQDAKLKLVVDDVPIEGRILDLEGKPVSGATIEVDYLNGSKNGNLDEWIAAVRARQSIQAAAAYLNGGVPLFSAQRWKGIKTDADGRFRLTGIGRERQLNIQVSGPTIVTSTLSVVTRDMKPLAQPAYTYPGAHDRTNYGAKFQYTAALSRPIEGIVNDAKTHKPIAGVEIWSSKFAGENISGITTIKTKTDANGHYRLEGMPKGTGNEIWIVPTDLPYFTHSLDVPDPPGMEPTPFDIELHRGQWVSGRVIDRITRRGVPARMYYIVAPDNPLAAELPEFKNGQHIMHVQDRYRTKPDGSYRVVGLPGRGVIGVGTSAPYPSGQGLESIKGVEDRESFMKYNGVFAPIKKHPTAVKEVQVSLDGDSTICDFELDPGRRITVQATDPSGEPIKDFIVDGCRGTSDNYQKIDSPAFDVVAMRDDEVRTVLVYQEARRLGKAIRLKASDFAMGPISVQLEPCATVIGKLVGADSQPVRGAYLRIDVDGDGDYSKNLQGTATHADGRFRHEGFLPGLAYNVYAEGSKIEFATVAKKLQVQPGETIDLGTIDITSDKRPEIATTATSASKSAEKMSSSLKARDSKHGAVPETSTKADAKSASATARSIKTAATSTINGHVVGADGKPVAGAKIYWITWSMRGQQPAPRLVATTDQKGGFQFESPEAITTAPETVTRGNQQQFVVVAQGHGMAYLGPDALRPSDPVSGLMKALVGGTTKATITLPAESSIKGRVVNIDGQPVKNARISIRRIGGEPVTGDTASRKDLAARGRDEISINWRLRLDNLLHRFFPAQLASVAPAATSGADGNFELAGVGADRLAQLLIEGDGIASALVVARTTPGDTLTIAPAPGFGSEPDKLHGAEFTHVAGPSKPVEGRVLDLDTGEPLVGAFVRTYAVSGEQLHSTRDRQHFAAVTDAKGHYRVAGLPIGKENKLVAFTTGEAPYVPIGNVISTDVTTHSVEQDFRLKRGTWAEGRAYDAATKKPLAGEVEYFMFRNAELERAVPGLRNGFMDEHYSTSADGKFRVPVLATRGILAFRYAPSAGEDRTKYPRGAGAEKIEGGKDIGGGAVHFLTIPHYIMPSNYEFLAEIKPTEDQRTISVDFALSTGREISVHVVDEEGKPVSALEFYGHSDNSGWQHTVGPNCKVIALQPGKSRKIFFFQRARNLVGWGTIDSQTQDGITVKLSPGGGVRGRLVNEDGEPITEATLSPSLGDLWNKPDAAIWPNHPDLRSNATNIPVDANGKFQIDGLIPGKTYSAWAVAPRKLNGMMMDQGIGVVLNDVRIEPGKTIDLGDIRPKSPDKRTSKERKSTTNTEPANAESKGSATSSERGLRIHGRITGPDGNAALKAYVAAIGFRKRVDRGGDLTSRDEVLGETTTNANGNYELTLRDVSSEAFNRATLIARADGAGIEWHQLDLSQGNGEVSLKLTNEQVIRGRLVDIEGKPAANVRISIVSVSPTSEGERFVDGVGFGKVDGQPAAWPHSMTSDDKGEFIAHGVAAGHGMYINVMGNARFAPQSIALNTGMPEQRGERDGTYRAQVVKNLKPGELAVLALAPAQIFEGKVIYEDTGKAAAHARLTIWASQQKFGSMYSVPGKADAKGHYRMSPHPGIRFGVTAYPPDGTAYLARELPPVDWEDAATKKQVDVKLPRGVLVRGKIVESITEQPVAGAAIQYVPEGDKNPKAHEGVLTGWQDIQISDASGTFEIAVPPGPGRLVVHGPQGEFVVKESTSRELASGRTGGQRQYANAFERIDPPINAPGVDRLIKLERAEKVGGQLVDERGQAIDEAIVISNLNINPYSLGWRGDSALLARNGRFEISGAAPGRELNVYFLDAKKRLGAAAKLKSNGSSPTVVLKPCGQAIARFKDSEGEPLTNFTPSLQLVATPGADPDDPVGSVAMKIGVTKADADFVANIDRKNHWPGPRTDDKGQITFPALIPGATYRLLHQRQGAKRFTVDPQQTIDLGEFVIDRNK